MKTVEQKHPEDRPSSEAPSIVVAASAARRIMANAAKALEYVGESLAADELRAYDPCTPRQRQG